MQDENKILELTLRINLLEKMVAALLGKNNAFGNASVEKYETIFNQLANLYPLFINKEITEEEFKARYEQIINGIR